MRLALVVLLLVSAALAGCLDQTEDLVPSGGGDDDDPDGADGGSGGNGTDEGNRSRPRDDGGSPNGTRNGTEGGAGDGADDGNRSRETDPGWPDPAEAEVRPGAPVLGGSCTANFVFASPDNASLYVGTAAHCLRDAGPGDRVSLAHGAAAGTVAYSSFAAMDRVNESSRAARTFNDFALIRVDPSFRGTVHPALLHYGGPTGLVPGAQTGDRVLTYGNSQVRDGADDLDPREGYVLSSSTWHVDLYLYGPGVPGDSGSPVVNADGEALGVLVTLEILPGPGSNDATKLSQAVEYMEDHGGPQVELATWSQFSDGRLPG